jgi:hypothetical protein
MANPILHPGWHQPHAAHPLGGCGLGPFRAYEGIERKKETMPVSDDDQGGPSRRCRGGATKSPTVPRWRHKVADAMANDGGGGASPCS